jgi:hypothetical protein
MRPYLHHEICKITHTQIIVIIDTSEQGYNVAISSEQGYNVAKSHTHIDLARRLLILLHVVIEQAPFLLMARRTDSWLAIRPQSFLA